MQGVYAIHVTGESYALAAGKPDEGPYKAGPMLYIRVMVSAGSIPATLTN